MLVGQLKQILEQAIANGYADYYVIFWEDEDISFTIDEVFEDDEHDVCLLSDDNAEEDTDFYAEKLLSELNQYKDDQYVYIACVDEGHQDQEDWDGTYDICEKDKDGNSDKLWYIDDEDCLCIDIEERSDEEDEELDETDPIAVRAEIERLQAILKDIEGKEEIEPESEETCDDMTVGQLKQILEQAIANGYENYYVFFHERNTENYYAIHLVFEDKEDEDKDVIVGCDANADEGSILSAHDVLMALNEYYDDKNVYFMFEDEDGRDYSSDICVTDKDGSSDKLWYFDKENGLYIDIEELHDDEEDEE